MTADVSISGLSHDFGPLRALDRITLDVAAGEFMVLLGPSGCGKSTLLSILGGFLSPTDGSVKIGGEDMSGIPPKARPTTTMFQDYALFPHLSLLDNVSFGLRMRGQSKSARHAKARDMLELVGLAENATQRPHALSGGQRQRVALARALAVGPDVLLLDEPLGALDLKLRRQMQDELKSIQRRIGTTFIHVTHDQEEAMAVSDRITVMNRGRIEDVGPPEDIYLKPRTLFSARFMGDLNTLRTTIENGGLMTAVGPVPGQAAANAVLGLRPENVGLSGEISLGRARLEESAFFATYHRCRFRSVTAPGVSFVAHLPIGKLPETGSEVDLYGSHPVLLEETP